MKLFLTGATGFIGRNLVEHYLKQDVRLGWHVRGDDLNEELVGFDPDVIINLAAEIYDPLAMWASNVEITRICCEYLRFNTKAKLIQVGSSSEYGKVARASKETDRINPLDMYQATKGMSTLLCQGYARTWSLDICIARPYSVYGRFEKPHRLFPRLWRAFVEQEPMKLHAGEHDFINVEDFVRGLDILVHHKQIPPGDIINFGSGIQHSNLQVLQLFEQISGITAPVELIDTNAKTFESKVWCCNTAYARKTYGFSCEIDLATGIRKFLEQEPC